jgi:hypothetical protein
MIFLKGQTTLGKVPNQRTIFPQFTQLLRSWKIQEVHCIYL